jgi:prolyl-tRNA synthetase
VDENTVAAAYRHIAGKAEARRVDDLVAQLPAELDAMQAALFEKAKAFRAANLHKPQSRAEFEALFKDGGKGGFALAPWDGDPANEKQLKADYAVTIRCLPLDGQDEAKGKVCVLSGKPAKYMAVFAKAY